MNDLQTVCMFFGCVLKLMDFWILKCLQFEGHPLLDAFSSVKSVLDAKMPHRTIQKIYLCTEL